MLTRIMTANAAAICALFVAFSSARANDLGQLKPGEKVVVSVAGGEQLGEFIEYTPQRWLKVRIVNSAGRELTRNFSPQKVRLPTANDAALKPPENSRPQNPGTRPKRHESPRPRSEARPPSEPPDDEPAAGHDQGTNQPSDGANGRLGNGKPSHARSKRPKPVLVADGTTPRGGSHGVDTFGKIYLVLLVASFIAAMTGFWFLGRRGPRGAVLGVAAALYAASYMVDPGSSRALVGLTGLLRFIGFCGGILGIIDLIRRPRTPSTGV